MSTNGYAAFLRSLGHNVRKEGEHFWFNVHPRVYMSFPFQHSIAASEVPEKKILGRDGLVLRHSCPLTEGRASYRLAINTPDYTLNSLKGKARNQTRRGLERCSVREMDFVELLEEGIVLNRETLLRQGRKIDAGFESYWRKYFRQAAAAEGAHAWGAFCEGLLAAYLVAFTMEDVSHILIVRSRRSLLSKYPNNALLYTYLETMLGGSSIREVSIGLESLQLGMETLDRFKLGMGFQKLPVGQRIVLSPCLKPLGYSLIGRFTITVAERLGNEHLLKFAGMLRWYLEQKKTHRKYSHPPVSM
ncbi:hypothetical protein ACLG6S_01190 [Thermodesulfobacteriota bacterium B35]